MNEECATTPYEHKASPYTAKQDPYKRKASPYGDLRFCPKLLQENGGFLLLENGNFIDL